MKKTVKNTGIRIKKKEALREKLRQENPEEAAMIATIQALYGTPHCQDTNQWYLR